MWRTPRKGAPINHDDILAQITFGVWPKLLPTKDTPTPASAVEESSGSKHCTTHSLTTTVTPMVTSSPTAPPVFTVYVTASRTWNHCSG